MPTYLITGANRGLGLEFVRQLSASANTILACSRAPSTSDDLKSLASSSKSAKIHILACDTGDLSSISNLKKLVSDAIGADGQIDYLLNNAGINNHPHETSLSMTRDALVEHMEVNVLGPAKVVETLQGFLKKGSLVMNMSSGLGSAGKTLNDIKESKCTTYSISKTALQMLTLHQSFALKEQGVRFINIDPGWVSQSTIVCANRRVLADNIQHRSKHVWEEKAPCSSPRTASVVC